VEGTSTRKGENGLGSTKVRYDYSVKLGGTRSGCEIDVTRPVGTTGNEDREQASSIWSIMVSPSMWSSQ
jgi:hypothetical protein